MGIRVAGSERDVEPDVGTDFSNFVSVIPDRVAVFYFVLDTPPRQNANKICFCARLIRIFVIRRTGVDPFGGVLRFAGGARPCPLLIFGKFTIYNDSYGRTAHRARVYRNAFRRCGNRRKAGVEHGLFYR